MSTPPFELQLVDRDRPRRDVVRDREQLIRRAKLLSWLSIGWMTVEASVAIAAAVLAGSVALLAFGGDSLIEMASAGTILWLYSASANPHERERRAQQLIAACFAALAFYVASDALRTLAARSHPAVSWLGAGVSLGAVIFMPQLARTKRRLAEQLGSIATAGDATQSWLCVAGAGAVLLSIIANTAAGWWWLDPIVGLVIGVIAAREAHRTWNGRGCTDCAPISFDAPAGRDRDGGCC